MTSMGRMPRIWVWVVAVAVACAAVAACGRLGSSSDYFSRGVDRLRAGKYKGAIADFDQVINIRSKYTNAYINRADAKIRLGQYEEVVADFEQAIRLQPDDASVYISRGNDQSQPDAPAPTSAGQSGSSLVNTRRRSPTLIRPSNCGPTTLTFTTGGAMPSLILINTRRRSPTLIRPSDCGLTTPTPTSVGAMPRSA